MIDVVFVIMLFFMVMAGVLRAERQLSLRLPGEPGAAISLPIEVSVGISEEGTILLNDETVDPAQSTDLAATRVMIRKISQQAAADGGKVIVTIEAEPEAGYGRVVDVLNALAAERLQDVTFGVSAAD